MEITQNRPPRRGPKGLYPWDEWADGQIRVAKRGVDFDTPPEAFRNAIYSAGHRRGMNTQAGIDYQAGTVTFCMTPKDQEAAA